LFEINFVRSLFLAIIRLNFLISATTNPNFMLSTVQIIDIMHNAFTSLYSTSLLAILMYNKTHAILSNIGLYVVKRKLLTVIS